jgi:hypothetical protein
MDGDAGRLYAGGGLTTLTRFNCRRLHELAVLVDAEAAKADDATSHGLVALVVIAPLWRGASHGRPPCSRGPKLGCDPQHRERFTHMLAWSRSYWCGGK